MARDRVVEFRIEGMRSLADVTLRLNGLSVLIGDNGSGKSTLVEAFELLRQAGTAASFIGDALLRWHGFDELLRFGAGRIRLSVRIESDGGEPPLSYSFAITREEARIVIESENLEVFHPSQDEPLHVIQRDRSMCRVYAKLGPDEKASLREVNFRADMLALKSAGAFAHPAVERVRGLLEAGVVHVPFETRPLWVASPGGIDVPSREPSNLVHADRLDRFGGNLPSLFQGLKDTGGSSWDRILGRVRAGLGDDLEDLRTPAQVEPGKIALQLKFRSLPRPIPASQLSEGTLAYLCFVALAELSSEQSFVVFDEPEAHLNPKLLVRVLWMLEELSASCPVVLATHSNALLDALENPAASTVVCELDEQRATRLRRLDKQALDKWLETYEGLGAIRDEGFLRQVLEPDT